MKLSLRGCIQPQFDLLPVRSLQLSQHFSRTLSLRFCLIAKDEIPRRRKTRH